MQRHQEIEKLILQKIISGDFRPGGMLPGRRDLAKTFNTSTITVGRAVEALVREGLLRSDDRRGTFVSESSAVRPLGLPTEILQVKELRIAVVATLFLPHQDTGYGHNPWTRQVVASLEQELAGAEHETLFINTVQTDESIVSLDVAVKRALDAKVDGIIALAFTNAGGEIEASEKLLIEAGIPSVMVSSMEINRSVPHVFPDGFDAGFQVGQHLIRQGCQRAAYIAPVRAWWMQQRLLGLSAAFQQAGFGPDAVTCYPAEPTTEWDLTLPLHDDAHEAALVAFRDLKPNVGFVGANDEISAGTIKAGRSFGLEPGRDYLLVSFDDNPEARNSNLTSMRIPWDSIGVEAARLLRQALAKQGECLQVRVRWKLIPRGSSRFATREDLAVDLS